MTIYSDKILYSYAYVFSDSGAGTSLGEKKKKINFAEFQMAKAHTYSFVSVLLLIQGHLWQFRSKVHLGQYPASKNRHKSEWREESMSKEIKYFFPRITL